MFPAAAGPVKAPLELNGLPKEMEEFDRVAVTAAPPPDTVFPSL